MVNFGQRLRQLRKERGLTQKELGTLIGIKNSVISFYELGERTPSPDIIKKMAIVLHCSADYLLGIEKKEYIDISDLSKEDKSLVQTMVNTLRAKYKK